MEDRDFELGQQIAEMRGAVMGRLDSIDEKFRALNGSVKEHEKRLSDYEGFKKNIQTTAANIARIWSTVISIAIPIIVSLILVKIFHITK